MDKDQIRKTIDACRPNHDDLGLPEMGELASCVESDAQALQWLKRSLQFDTAVSEAFTDVPVPDDLCKRLIEQVRNPDSQNEPIAERSCYVEEAINESQQVSSASLTRAQIIRRTGLIAAAGSLIVAASLLVIFGVFGSQEPIGTDEFASEIPLWTDLANSTDEGLAWQPTSAAQVARPIDRFVRLLPTRSARFSNRFDGKAAMYDFGPNKKAFLFVVSSTRGFAAPAAPAPIVVSGGWSVAVWSRGGLLYVIATRDGSWQQFVERRTFG